MVLNGEIFTLYPVGSARLRILPFRKGRRPGPIDTLVFRILQATQIGMRMGISLSQTSVSELDACIREDLLTYVDYSESQRRCFSYPQYLVDERVLCPISPTVFPELGILPMSIAGNSDSQDLENRFGDIVVMRISDQHFQDNRFYRSNESGQGRTEPHKYNGVIDPNRPRGRSQIEFIKLRQHSLSSTLIQVMRVQDVISFGKRIVEPLHPVAHLASPQTKFIVIEYTDGGSSKYYGPFEFSTNSDGSFKIRSSNDFDRIIAAIDKSDCKTSIDLRDKNGKVVASFLSSEEIREAFLRSNSKYDWLPDEELISLIAKVAKSDPLNLTKSESRALRTFIQKATELSAAFELTDDRRERMVDLISGADAWNELPDELKKAAIASAPVNLLADYVLSDENFRSFYDRVIENEEVRLAVEKRRALYTNEIEELEGKAREAKAEAEKFQNELDALNACWDARIAEQTKEISEKASEKKAELESLADEVEGAREELKRIQDDKAVVAAQIRSVVQSMTDDVTLSKKILENEMIRQVIQAVAPAQIIAAEPAVLQEKEETNSESSAKRSFFFLEGEDEASPKEMLEGITHGITELADRELTPNEVANLLICVTQGYITTLAGMPGTGKTSLVGILAGALGLTNPAQPRFCELSVEKGWTSYRDYIGYFNPFKNSLEKTSAEIFDAFALLNEEAGADLTKVPPYLFLLDEANLSSIEHYWSPFLRSCDNFATEDTIVPLGGSEVFRVPRHTRWIATVNFDYTTEELSPRFLDRSWVITLGSKIFDFDSDDLIREPHDFSSQPAISYANLQRVFGTRRDSTPAQEQQTKLREVLEACARHKWTVSPRSQRMMGNYIQTAAELMDLGTADDAYAPVDFAVTQKILPLVNGPADRIQSFVDDLSEIGGLPRMVERLSRMRELGEESGFYQYFA